MNEIKEKDNDIIPEKLVCVKTDGTIFNFDFLNVRLILLQVFMTARLH